MKFTDEDIAFLDKLNNTGTIESNIYITAQHGYIRNLDRNMLKGLEAIYKRAFDQPKFTMCYHCANDVMKIVLQVYRELDKQKAMQEQISGMVETTISGAIQSISEVGQLQALEYEPKKLSKSKK